MRALTVFENYRKKFHQWNEASRQRRQLRNMSDRMLKDIGLSRIDAERIASGLPSNAVNKPDVTLKRYASPTLK